MTINFDPLTLYKTDILIESGTFRGAFLMKMRDKYKTIHTIEIVPYLYDEAKNKFKNNPEIEFHLGHSPFVLKQLLSTIDDSVTFWLDAHYQLQEQPEHTKKPLLDELSVIKNHHINTHMIMIDDVRLFKNYGTSKEDVEKILLDINPDYSISYHPGYIEDDVVVALID